MMIYVCAWLVCAFSINSRYAAPVRGTSSDSIAGVRTKDDKHATELDLSCLSYDDFNWAAIKADMWEVAETMDVNILKPIVALLKTNPNTDCYLGQHTAGLLSIIFMQPHQRVFAVEHSEFVSVTWKRQIPLTFWDTMEAHYPIFTLMDVLAGVLQKDVSEGRIPSFLHDLPESPSTDDVHFLVRFQEKMMTAADALQCISEPPFSRQALCYFILSSHLLGKGRQREASQLMLLGERSLPSSWPVYKLLLLPWPLWRVLRQMERHVLEKKVHVPLMQAPPVEDASRRIPASGGRDDESCDNPHKVHVALSGDLLHLRGVLATVRSVLLSSNDPANLCVHLFAMAREIEIIQEALRCSFQGIQKTSPNGTWRWNGAGITLRTIDAAKVAAFMGKSRHFLCHYDPQAFSEYCQDAADAVNGGAADQNHDDVVAKMMKMIEEAGNLNTPHNFVRFWLPTVLGFLDRVVYLDSDVIVKRDVADLYHSLDANYALAAVARTQVPLGTYFTRTHRWYPLFSWPSFNAGVVVFNLAFLRGMRPSLIESVQALQEENSDGTMWRHGSQPPLLLLFFDKVQWIDRKWNVDGLGYRNRSDVDDAFILHWTGPMKPWREDGHNKALWVPYDAECALAPIKTWNVPLK
eukprot:GEMP01027879.1.p1 GENE.GEMP01027879.1~~GEMP01027879.1.p1  ORF type:complete len:636 (+),score=143.92 GEMP01027879.1:141-2048(+)